MTYADLEILIKSMTEEQRLCDVTVKMGDDEMHPVKKVDLNWDWDLGTDILDPDHPFLSI